MANAQNLEPLKKLSAVAFDLDGTLIDAREWHYKALNEALSYFSCSITRNEQETWADGLPTKVKLEKLNSEGRLPPHLNDIVSQVKQDRTLRQIACHLFPVIDHLLLLEWLASNGIKIAVVTNSIRQSAETMLRAAGLLGYVDEVVTNEDVAHSKPDPEMYLLAAKRMSVDSSMVLAIEDSPYGVEAAKRAGCIVAVVSNPSELSISFLSDFIQKSGYTW